MAPSVYRNSTMPRVDVNLYCAQCNAQLGIFDNEWIRLTTSYARSKDDGTHFGTEVGDRTQVVPSGPAQRSAEGCRMAEVFCRKCSNMVGQYCKSAPDEEKQLLVNQYFYKLSRTYLKDSRTFAKVEPVFGYGRDMDMDISTRSSIKLGSTMTPPSRWAETPMRQSSRTPAASLQGTSRNIMRREPPSAMTKSDDHKWETKLSDVSKVRAMVVAQQSALAETKGRIESQSIKLETQEARLTDQEADLEEHGHILSAQAVRIDEQDKLIKTQARTMELQQTQLSAITNHLINLNKVMDDFRATLQGFRSSLGNTISVIGGIGINVQKPNSIQDGSNQEGENAAADLPKDTAVSETVGIRHSLGKRKRIEQETFPSEGAEDKANTDSKAPRRSGRLSGRFHQMPTPQSSDGGQRSPEQTPCTHVTHNQSPISTTLQNDQENEMVNESGSTVDATENGACATSHSPRAGFSEEAMPQQEQADTDKMHLVTVLSSAQTTEEASSQPRGPHLERYETTSVQNLTTILADGLEALIVSSKALIQDLAATKSDADAEGVDGHAVQLVSVRQLAPPRDVRNHLTNFNERSDSEKLPKYSDFQQDDADELDFAEDEDLYDGPGSNYSDEDIGEGEDGDYMDTSEVNLAGWQSRNPQYSAAAPDHATGSSTINSWARESTGGKRTTQIRSSTTPDVASQLAYDMMAEFSRSNHDHLTAPLGHRDRELVELGLSEWIGKDKNCRAYRYAVEAARSRERNLRKTSYLESRGLHRTASSHYTLTPKAVSSQQSRSMKSILTSDIRKQSAPSRSNSLPKTEILSSSESEYNGGRLSQRSPNKGRRMNRTGKKRNSVRLPATLDTYQDQEANTKVKPISRERRSSGTRKSDQRLAVEQLENEDDDSSDQMSFEDNLEDVDQRVETEQDVVMNDTTSNHEPEPDTSVSNVRRARGRPGKSLKLSGRGSTGQRSQKAVTVSRLSISAPEAVIDGIDIAKHTATLPTDVLPIPNSVLSEAAKRQASSAHSAPTEEQLEETIRLRDQMAKELMELEEMGM